MNTTVFSSFYRIWLPEITDGEKIHFKCPLGLSFIKRVFILVQTEHTAEDASVMFRDHVKFSGAMNQEFDFSVTLFVRR